MKREPGYYWVKYQGNWEIAKWWEYMTGRFEWDYFDRIMTDNYFQEIDERRIEREEPGWQVDGTKTIENHIGNTISFKETQS